MKHYVRLTTSSQNIEEIEMVDKEFIILADEREIIEVGTQIVYICGDKELTLEVIEIKDNKVIWQIKKVNKRGNKNEFSNVNW